MNPTTNPTPQEGSLRARGGQYAREGVSLRAQVPSSTGGGYVWLPTTEPIYVRGLALYRAGKVEANVLYPQIFHVTSNNTVYTVDLCRPHCDCETFEYAHGEVACKHMVAAGAKAVELGRGT